MKPEKEAKKLIKEAKVRLRKKGKTIQPEVKERLTLEVVSLEEALAKRDHKKMEKAQSKLEDSLRQHLAFRRKSTAREYAEAIIVAAVLAMFIRTFVVQAFKIPSGSMEQTLLVGDHILVSKFIYGTKIPLTDTKVFPLTQPKRGDVIVFVYPVDPSKDFIKRIIGVPGDVVQVTGTQVLVNGKRMEEPYAIYDQQPSEPRENFGPVTVPQGSYFVMGDNRDKSYDSRYWGFVKESKIKGRALVLYWSWDSSNFGVRWRRLGHLIR